MDEIGLDIADHKPMTFEELEDSEGLNFDLIVTLAPEAHHKALELTRTLAADVEYWPTPDPTVAKALASRSSRPIARCATGCCCAFASAFQRSGRRAARCNSERFRAAQIRPYPVVSPGAFR